MRHSGFRGWMWLGAAASAALLSVGCGRLERASGNLAENEPRLTFFGALPHAERWGGASKYHVPSDRGYNGTIAQVGSSIDPRTPELAGTQGRSRLTDITGYMGRPDIVQGYGDPPTSLGIGGSGLVDPVTGTSESGWRSRPEGVPVPVHQEQSGEKPMKKGRR
jgi:hypothetical protein